MELAEEEKKKLKVVEREELLTVLKNADSTSQEVSKRADGFSGRAEAVLVPKKSEDFSEWEKMEIHF